MALEEKLPRDVRVQLPSGSRWLRTSGAIDVVRYIVERTVIRAATGDRSRAFLRTVSCRLSGNGRLGRGKGAYGRFRAAELRFRRRVRAGRGRGRDAHVYGLAEVRVCRSRKHDKVEEYYTEHDARRKGQEVSNVFHGVPSTRRAELANEANRLPDASLAVARILRLGADLVVRPVKPEEFPAAMRLGLVFRYGLP
jgi:hypothetical protein